MSQYHSFENMERAKRSKEWVTISGGTIANRHGFKGIQDNVLFEVATLLNQGRYGLTLAGVKSRIEVGRIAGKLKQLLGKKFWQTIREHWFHDYEDKESARRHLEISMQMYRFSINEGRYFPKDLPVDSYLHVIRKSNEITDHKKKRKFLDKLQSSSEDTGLSLKNTKRLRKQLKEIQEELLNEADEIDRNKILIQKIKGFCFYMNTLSQEFYSRSQKMKDLLDKYDGGDGPVDDELKKILALFSILKCDFKERHRYFIDLAAGKDQE